MKRTVALALLGVAAATTAYGQGGINIGNYQAPWNPIVFDASINGGRAVNSGDGVALTLWYGEGALTDSMALDWKLDSEALGYNGYYALTLVTLPQWTSGDIYDFQVRAEGGGYIGQSVVWQEQANINDISGTPPGLPGLSTESIGLTVGVVPEPSTFALAGLGAAALLVFRRRS